MVVEFLTFAVNRAERDGWLAADEVTWTAFLRSCPGFLRKEVWAPAESPDEIHAVIWWENRASWSAVTPAQVAEVDARLGTWRRTATMRAFDVVG